MRLWYFIQDWWRGNTFGGLARSSTWPQFKMEFAKTHPKLCAICDNKKVELHHKQSFATHPKLEEDENNVVWLCEGLGTLNHHRGVGHLGAWTSLNENIEEDIKVWRQKFLTRPKWDGKMWLYPKTEW